MCDPDAERAPSSGQAGVPPVMSSDLRQEAWVRSRRRATILLGHSKPCPCICACADAGAIAGRVRATAAVVAPIDACRGTVIGAGLRASGGTRPLPTGGLPRTLKVTRDVACLGLRLVEKSIIVLVSARTRRTKVGRMPDLNFPSILLLTKPCSADFFPVLIGRCGVKVLPRFSRDRCMGRPFELVLGLPRALLDLHPIR